MAKAKTYVLLPHMHPSAPIYRQVSKTQRVPFNRLVQWSPYLQVRVETEEGQNKVLRLKMNCNSIWQDEQIEKYNIPANEKFTDAEYRAIKFRYGQLITTNETVQKFLDSHPQFEGFKGSSDPDVVPAFTVFDKASEIRTSNRLFRKRLEAAEKIRDLDLKGAEELLLQIHGASFELPKDGDEEDRYEECVQLLVDFLDSSDSAVDEILRVRGTIDDKIAVLLGKAVRFGILNFDIITDQVSIKRSANREWEQLKYISSDLPLAQRQIAFGQFLISEKGALVLEDLQTLVQEREGSVVDDNIGGVGSVLQNAIHTPVSGQPTAANAQVETPAATKPEGNKQTNSGNQQKGNKQA